MTRLPADAVVITGIGMCSSLGNAVMACAAARAGMSLSRELAEVVITCRNGADAALVGHPVVTAAGFQGMGKLVSLGAAALADLLDANDLRNLSFDRTGLYLCLRANAPDGRRLCERLTALSSLPLPESAWNHLGEGHAGFIRAVGAALTRLRAGQWHRCLVGGLDSLIDESVLGPLLDSGRLKTPDKPDGLQPGEAGAFVLLERFDAAEKRGAKALAAVSGVSVGVDLAEAIAPLAETAREGIWLLSDHNGEHRRAAELGNVLSRISGRFPTLSALRPSYPATSFGDTGAASAAIAACLVARAFARGYAPAPGALILSSSDHEARGALCLKRLP